MADNLASYSGVNELKRETPLVVSLTSYEERFEDLTISIYSLLNQSIKPDRIILWLSDKLSLNDEELNLMTRVISSHMGIWNKDFNDNEVLPVPKDKYERFVHLCDYLSSKKFLNVDFDGIDIKY